MILHLKTWPFQSSHKQVTFVRMVEHSSSLWYCTSLTLGGRCLILDLGTPEMKSATCSLLSLLSLKLGVSLLALHKFKLSWLCLMKRYIANVNSILVVSFVLFPDHSQIIKFLDHYGKKELIIFYAETPVVERCVKMALNFFLYCLTFCSVLDIMQIWSKGCLRRGLGTTAPPHSTTTCIKLQTCCMVQGNICIYIVPLDTRIFCL